MYGKKRSVINLLITSAAIVNNLIPAACNYRVFKGIPGLKVESWSS